MAAKSTLALASVFLGTIAALAVPANAACKKFGFTVNDYGKEGPTNDAKNLLDKHIAQWASQNGVASYQTGKKNVSCELFIDVILFDEYTCTASATVCWGNSARKVGQQSAAGEDDGDHPGSPVRKAEALGQEAPQPAIIAGTPSDDETPASGPAQADAAPQQDDSAASETYAAAPSDADDATPAAHADASASDAVVSDPEQPAVEAAASETPAQPLDHVAAEASQPVVQPAVANTAAIAVPEAPAATQTVETGALQGGAGMAAAPATPPAAPASAMPSVAGRAAAASAAAEAAAAAERAAQAAETAANAAKAAAAAAVAASEASKSTGHASVPPLDQAADAR